VVRGYFFHLYTDEGEDYAPYILPTNRFPSLHEDIQQLYRQYTGADVK